MSEKPRQPNRFIEEEDILDTGYIVGSRSLETDNTPLQETSAEVEKQFLAIHPQFKKNSFFSIRASGETEEYYVSGFALHPDMGAFMIILRRPPGLDKKRFFQQVKDAIETIDMSLTPLAEARIIAKFVI